MIKKEKKLNTLHNFLIPNVQSSRKVHKKEKWFNRTFRTLSTHTENWFFVRSTKLIPRNSD